MMLWIKRLVPLVVLLAALAGWHYYRQYEAREAVHREQARALTTAKVWLAAARYRDDARQFAVVRDTILAQAGISREQMTIYLHRFDERPEHNESFVRWVEYYVDSLTGLFIPDDSLPVAGSVDID